MEDRNDDNISSPKNSRFKLDNDDFGEFGEEWDDNNDDFESYSEPIRLKNSSNKEKDTRINNSDFKSHSNSMKASQNIHENNSDAEYLDTIHENFQIVEPPLEYQKYLETLRLSSVIKMICGVIFVCVKL